MRTPALLRRAGFPWRAPTWPGGVERLPLPRRTGAYYDTDWARRYGPRLARVAIVNGLLRPVVHAFTPPEIDGVERLDTLDGPAVFAANHHSHMDTPLLLSVIPEPWRHRLVVAAAADYFFDNRATAAASALVLNAIPVERTRVTRRSADQLADLLDRGWSVLIFPEGGRSPDGWGKDFRGGAAYLSIRCRVPVVPIYLEGTQRVLAKGMRRPRPGPVSVRFGDLLRPDDDDDARRFGARIQSAVAALADEHASDWWTARRRAAADATPPLTGPAAPAWRRTWALGDRRPRRASRDDAWPWSSM